MISRKCLTLVDDHQNPVWEFRFFRGMDDWRLGVYVERHPSETQVSIHVPMLSLVIFRYR